MILAIFRVMMLSLIRDRGALVMAFMLPPLIFLIFAAIFSASSSDALSLRIAFARAQPDAFSNRFETALRREASMRVSTLTSSSRADVEDLVRKGAADVGLFIDGSLTRTDTAPFVILVEPGKRLAGGILAGQVQKLVSSHLSDVALSRSAISIETLVGGFTENQRARLSSATDALAQHGADTAQTPSIGLLEVVTIGSRDGASATVTYYAGAVAILFLLLSAMQSAATLIDDRMSGILDRVAVGPAGTDVVFIGKFLFLTAQGVVQASLIFTVAALVYDVEITEKFTAWLLITVAAASAASALALIVATACTTKQQAQTNSTFLVLIFSAIGGSMVPRFMMPEWLQEIGKFMPNAWAIEAYYGSLWRDDTLLELLPGIVSLLAVALVGSIFALVVSRLRLRL